MRDENSTIDGRAAQDLNIPNRVQVGRLSATKIDSRLMTEYALKDWLLQVVIGLVAYLHSERTA